jgi:hypothetical protein
MPATRSSRRKKSGLISGAATRVAALATTVGSKIGATVREPAAQIATFVHDTAQHLPVIGARPKRTRPKAKAKVKRTARGRARRAARA